MTPLVLAAALAVPGPSLPREGLRIAVEQLSPGRSERAVVYGDGVAFWNETSFLRVPGEEVDRLLALLERSGLRTMPSSFGAGPKRLVRRVSIKARGFEKEVVQLRDGEQSAALATLASALLDVLRPRLQGAVVAGGMEDALGGLARGELPAQALSLIFVRKPPDAAPESGFVFRLEAGETSDQAIRAGRFGETRPLGPAGDVVRQVAAVLADGGLAQLPANLFAPVYTEIVVTALGHRKALQARPFAGMTPSSKGRDQERFDRLAEGLERIRRRLLPAP